MALSYTRSILKAISASVEASQPRCPFDLWRRLIDHGISRAKPTGRGYRGGIRKCKALHQHQNIQAEFARGSRDHFCILDKSFQEESGISEVEAHLHNGPRETLNIQDDTFGREGCPIHPN